MAAPSVGRYRLLEPLANGENGAVYLAQDTILDRRVAYRVLSDEILRDRGRLDRLLHALRSASPLRHPNIATICEFGEEDSKPFVATEYIAGVTLAEMLRGEPLSVSRALEWMEDLASALLYAHRNGVVHGDLNPDNLMVDDDGTLKVLNFGMCSPGWAREVAGGLPAQVNYLSPEQLQGWKAGQKTDVFAFGTILYEMVSGRKAFPGQRGPALIDRIEHDSPAPLAHRNAAIAQIVERCLEKDPARRYDSMDELRGALSRLREEVGKGVDDAASDGDDRVVHPPPAASSDDDRASAMPRGARERAAQDLPSMDENVQFTVYRPAAVVPERWYPMLAFAHLAERRPDAATDEPDPVAEVRRQANQILGEEATSFRHLTQDSGQPIPAAGHLRLVPIVPGVEFNPSERSFVWLESVHREEFRLRAGRDVNGRTARGLLSVYLGHLLIADVAIAIAVDDRAEENKTAASETARPYRRIFASYSHRDSAVVQQFEEYSRGFGDRYMRDVIDLRAGDVWTSRLGEMIERADVFQLFWSWNAMGSSFVRSEWEHALSMNRAHFIRPVYWEQPFPQHGDLPPSALRTLHFAHVGSVVRSGTRGSAPTDAAPAPLQEMRAREAAERERRRIEMERAESARAREAARVAVEEEARRRAEADQRRAAEAEAEVMRRVRTEEETRRLAEMESRRAAEAEAKGRAEAAAVRAAEEAMRFNEMEWRRAAEDALRRSKDERMFGAAPDTDDEPTGTISVRVERQAGTAERPRPSLAPARLRRSRGRLFVIPVAAAIVLVVLLALSRC